MICPACSRKIVLEGRNDRICWHTDDTGLMCGFVGLPREVVA
jgi:hypothetical protein